MTSDVAIQSKLINELREIIGGPASLRWPSHRLLPALASAAGYLSALTLRPADDFATFAHNMPLPLATMRTSFRIAEPSPDPLVPLSEAQELGQTLLTLLAKPQPYKKPSNLVLGAVVAVLVQLADLRQTSRDDALDLIEQARQATPQEAVRTFQQNKDGPPSKTARRHNPLH